MDTNFRAEGGRNRKSSIEQKVLGMSRNAQKNYQKYFFSLHDPQKAICRNLGQKSIFQKCDFRNQDLLKRENPKFQLIWNTFNF